MTLWGPQTATYLSDYAGKLWHGLVGDYYLYRWTWFTSAVLEALQTQQPFIVQEWSAQLQDWEQSWTHVLGNSYPTEPSGDALQIAQFIASKYFSAALARA